MLWILTSIDLRLETALWLVLEFGRPCSHYQNVSTALMENAWMFAWPWRTSFGKALETINDCIKIKINTHRIGFQKIRGSLNVARMLQAFTKKVKLQQKTKYIHIKITMQLKSS
jgi:hypothetical protein